MDGPYHDYVLRSQVTGRFYVGSTGNIDDRLFRHNSGQPKATKHGIPWDIIHQEVHATQSDALRREKYYKTGKGREEIRRRLAIALD